MPIDLSQIDISRQHEMFSRLLKPRFAPERAVLAAWADAVRICNSFDSKVRCYRDYYKDLPHVAGSPYVIGIAAFDRPMAHFAASRPIIAAIYGPVSRRGRHLAGRKEGDELPRAICRKVRDR